MAGLACMLAKKTVSLCRLIESDVPGTWQVTTVKARNPLLAGTPYEEAYSRYPLASVEQSRLLSTPEGWEEVSGIQASVLGDGDVEGSESLGGTSVGIYGNGALEILRVAQVEISHLRDAVFGKST